MVKKKGLPGLRAQRLQPRGAPRPETLAKRLAEAVQAGVATALGAVGRIDGEVFAKALADQVAAHLGVDIRAELAKSEAWAGREAIRAQKAARDEDEARAVDTPGRKQLRPIAHQDRALPTLEAASKAVLDTVPAERFDTGRKGERVLVNLRAQGGGAGEMHHRGTIDERQFAAAVRLCQLEETAKASQLSGLAPKERVEGGMIGGGGMLEQAAVARGEYDLALKALGGPATRVLMVRRVVECLPMEKAVDHPVVVELLGGGTVRHRCAIATKLLIDGLDALAEHFGLPQRSSKRRA